MGSAEPRPGSDVSHCRRVEFFGGDHTDEVVIAFKSRRPVMDMALLTPSDHDADQPRVLDGTHPLVWHLTQGRPTSMVLDLNCGPGPSDGGAPLGVESSDLRFEFQVFPVAACLLHRRG